MGVVEGQSSHVHFFFTAARLDALVPISSAAVELIFSQVKLIVESVGENVLKETVEMRLMERVNRTPGVDVCIRPFFN